MTKKVLIVDDEPQMLSLLSTRLRSEGYEVITAFSGEGCLEKAEQDQPDLILLDVLLPGMSGFEVSKRLKKNPRTKDIPIIMVTALIGDEASKKSLESGAIYFVSKPFDTQTLLSEISEAIKK